MGWVLMVLGVIRLTAGFSLMAGHTYGQDVRVAERKQQAAGGDQRLAGV